MWSDGYGKVALRAGMVPQHSHPFWRVHSRLDTFITPQMLLFNVSNSLVCVSVCGCSCLFSFCLFACMFVCFLVCLFVCMFFCFIVLMFACLNISVTLLCVKVSEPL